MPGAKWRMGGEQAHAGMRNEDEDVEGHGKRLANEDEEPSSGAGPDNLRVRVRNTEEDTEGHARRLANEDEDTEGHVSRVK